MFCISCQVPTGSFNAHEGKYWLVFAGSQIQTVASLGVRPPTVSITQEFLRAPVAGATSKNACDAVEMQAYIIEPEASRQVECNPQLSECRLPMRLCATLHQPFSSRATSPCAGQVSYYRRSRCHAFNPASLPVMHQSSFYSA